MQWHHHHCMAQIDLLTQQFWLERGRKIFEKVKRSRGLYLDGLYLALSKRATNNTLQLMATVEY